MPNLKAQFFFDTSKVCMEGAIKKFDDGRKNSLRPYDSFEAHGDALYKPFLYLEDCVGNLARIASGSISLIHALFVQPWNALPHVFGGLCFEVLGLAFNVINALVSCVSLLTRSLATIFNLGYGASPQPRKTPEPMPADNIRDSGRISHHALSFHKNTRDFDNVFSEMNRDDFFAQNVRFNGSGW